MNLTELKNSRKLFWYIQIPAWFIFTLLTVLLYYERTFHDWFNFLFHVLEYFLGFIGSLILRIMLKHFGKKFTSLFSISLLVIFSSIICGHFWLLSANYFWALLAKGEYTIKYILNMTISGYTFRIFWITLIYCGWGALYLFIKTWLDLQKQTEQTLKAQTLVKEAQLQMLRYQLNPHFLFNSLNSISVLIDENKVKAKEMVNDLSEFLRYTLISKNYTDVPLAKEIKAIKRYLDIEKKRYEEKMEVEYKIDEEAEEYPIPSFLIHPLVENAVKYGMQTTTLPLRIIIQASANNGGLKISITNSGRWVNDEDKQTLGNGTGTGLENIRKRLTNAYPDSYKMNIFKRDGHVEIVIEINKTNLSRS